MDTKGFDTTKRCRSIVLERIERIVRRRRNRSIVIAVSAGGDSVALARLLAELAEPLRLRLSIGHFSHDDDDDDRADASFVADLANSLGLEVDFGRHVATRPNPSEEVARRDRLSWLGEVAQARSAGYAALGHTLDDQAETVLHRIIRGSGLTGLGGIPPLRRLTSSVVLIRPLLALTRDELRGYLAAIGQSYRDDPTNADVSRTRARIRHELLPTLKESFNPRIAAALARLADSARANRRDLDRTLAPILDDAVLSLGETEIVLNRSKIAAEPLARRAELLRTAWRRAGWGEKHMSADRWNRLARRARSGNPRRFSVGHGVEATIKNDTVHLFKAH